MKTLKIIREIIAAKRTERRFPCAAIDIEIFKAGGSADELDELIRTRKVKRKSYMNGFYYYE